MDASMFKMFVFNRLSVLLMPNIFFLLYITCNRMDQTLKLGIQVDRVICFITSDGSLSPGTLYIMGLEAGEGGCTAEQRIGKNGF